MNALLLRNLRVYFRDKASVFFSLLSVLIIILLYALFLGDAWSSGSVFQGRAGVKNMMDSWIMAGLLAVVSVTSTMSRVCWKAVLTCSDNARNCGRSLP